jgi:NADH-quinone oxidoreductase subunit C
MQENSGIQEFVNNLIGNGLISHTVDKSGIDILFIDRDKLVDLLQILRDEPEMRFRHLSFLTAADYPDDDYRFTVIYELRSNDFRRIRIKVQIRENDAWIPTITGVFPTANWHEREMMELFGIEVRNHPDPGKLLLPEWVEENPLRKDFPHGGEELWAFHKKVIDKFNNQQEYQGNLRDPWLERFND